MANSVDEQTIGTTESSGEPYDKAREAVKRVFDLLGVTKVVVVDDELNREPTQADFISRYRKWLAEKPGRLMAIAQFKGIAESSDFEADIRPELEKIWDQAAAELREEMLSKMEWIAPKKTFDAIGKILADYPVSYLSLNDWNQQIAGLTTEAHRKETLFLFDLDMSKEGGRTDEGMHIIKALLQNGERCQCGLISHLIQNDAEYSDWQKYVADHGLQAHQHRFVVISKKHLPRSPLVFAQRLKRAAISPPCDELRREVASVLDRAFNNAKHELEALSVFDFEEIVFQSSYAEGAWEPDTVLRILALFTQREARTLLKQNHLVEKTASKIRNVVHIDYRPADAPAPSSQKIVHLENYEDGAFLRDHHIPLDLGDIFRIGSDERTFILLGQPCDLMCRNVASGTRVNQVFVAPVEERTPMSLVPAYWELKAYETKPAHKAYVNFHGARAVPILPLDLTVFDKDGKSRIRVGEQCPDGVIPAWRLRYDALAERAATMLQEYEASVAAIPEAETSDAGQAVAGVPAADPKALIRVALTGGVPEFLTGKLDVVQRVLEFDVERIGRLKQPRASSLLRAFTGYISRDAFDHDLDGTLAKMR